MEPLFGGDIMPPLPSMQVMRDEEQTRRIKIIRLLVAAGGNAADAGIEEHPLYLRAFPKAEAEA